MVDPDASRFWKAARRCDLIGDGDLQAWWQAIPPEKRTVDRVDRYLARQAVDAGKLTIWQAQQLLNGRWQGLRLGKYVLTQPLGQGGMGRVYRARDTRLGRDVALKILSRERSTNPRAVARFDREARVGAQLQHENLIRIYDAGEVLGLRYLVMELVDGKTAHRLIEELGRLDPEVAAELGRQVLLGLEHLDEKGLLHRDVNPANILVDRAGTAKLTDLGLALDLDDPEVLTRDGAAVGTFDYIAPEQARNPRGIDIRCDIYALGCSLYHMIAGRVPFPGLNPGERIMAHQLADPPSLAELVPGCPPGLSEVVRRMMHKAPEGRYARAREAAAALAPYSGGPRPLDRITRPAPPAPPGAATGPGPAHAPFATPPELPPASTPRSAPVSSSNDVFKKIDVDPGPPVLDEPPPGPPGTGPIPGPRTTRELIVLAAVALAAVALVLGLLSWF